MKLLRIFSAASFRGTRNYLNSQKKYEIIRTLLYLGISLILYLTGYFTTKNYNASMGVTDVDPRQNLLTIVAVLGCLPASKSAVSAIMFLRFHSCSDAAASAIAPVAEGMTQLYDMVFTSSSINFQVAHLVVRGNTICGFTESERFDENAFHKHIDGILRADGFQDVTVKIFRDLKRYTDRLAQIRELDADEKRTEGIVNTLKSVAL